jgi:hypothetical protein
MKIGAKGTGATCHLDSDHAEAYSLQILGEKAWMLGDYYEVCRSEPARYIPSGYIRWVYIR